MADALESMLLSLGVDLTPVKDVANQLPGVFAPAFDKIKDDLDKITSGISKTAKDSSASIKESTAEYQKMMAELKKGLDATKEKITAELKGLDSIKKEGEAHSKVTKEIKEQNEALKLQGSHLSENNKKVQEEAGLMAKIRESAVEGTFGGGALGKIVGGALTGGLIGSLLTALPQAIGTFIEKMREAAREGSEVVALTVAFQGMAGGVEQAANRLDALHEKTEGLVSDQSLMALSLAMTKNGFHYTRDEIEKFAHALENLAEVRGKASPEEVSKMATSMMERGMFNARAIAKQLGISQDSLRGEEIAPITDPNKRRIAESEAQIRKLIQINDVLEKTGFRAPATIEDAVAKISIALKNLWAGFSVGITFSAGTQFFISQLGQMGDKLNSLKGFANKFGEAVGWALGVVTVVGRAAFDILQEIGIVLANKITKGADQSGKGIQKIGEKVPPVKQMIEGFVDALIDVKTQILLIINGFDDLGKSAGKITPVIEGIARVLVTSVMTQLPWFLGGSKGPAILAGPDAFGKRLQHESTIRELGDQRKKLGDTEYNRRLANENSRYSTYTSTGVDISPVQDAMDQLKTAAADLATPNKNDPGQKRILAQGAAEKKSVHQSLADATQLNVNPGNVGLGTDGTPQRDAQEMARLQEQAALQAAKAQRDEQVGLNQIKYELAKAGNDRLREEDAAAYAAGEESAKAHYQTMRDIIASDAEAEKTLRIKNYQERLDQIQKDEQAQMALLQKRKGWNLKDPAYAQLAQNTHAAFQAQRQQAAEEFNKNLVVSQGQTQGKLAGVNRSETADTVAGQIKDLQDQLQTAEQAVDMQRKMTQQAQSAGVITPEEYEDREKQAIASLHDLRVQQANDEFALGENNETRRAEARAKANKADMDSAMAIYDLENKSLRMRMEAITRDAQVRVQMGQNTLNFQQANPGAPGSQANTMIQIRTALAQEFQANAKLLTPENYQNNRVDYDATVLKMQELTAEMDKWDKAIVDITSVTVQLGTGLKGLVQSVSGIFTRPGTQAALNTLGTGFTALQNSGKLGNQLTGGTGNYFGNMADTFGAIFHHGATSEDRDDAAMGDEHAPTYKGAGDALGKFSTGLVTAAQSVGSFVASLTQAKDPVSGAVGGAAGGAGLGGSLTSGMGQISSALPIIGPAIGATIGLVMGGVMGKKNKMVQENIDNAANSFKIIMVQYGQNNNNLQTTVIALENLISQLTAEKDNSKKGKQQYQQSIDQYSQQLQQLEDQQVQIINNLYKQLSVLDAPLGDTDTVTQLQQILQSYNQFLGAAQNAQQLGMANQFLQESIQNLETTTSQQLNQNQEQAITDAIQLNDQLYQRFQLTKQYNDQVQGILSQGVLTRQQTMAQSKGQQIEDATDQYNRQLQDLNEQITVSQYRVQAEQQIFSLATTRAGLELQLANVQMEAVNMDMARISALAQLAQAFSTGNWQFAPIQSIIQNIGAGMPATQTVGGNAAQLLSQALNGVNSSTFLNAVVAGAYTSYATNGTGNFNGAGLV